MTLTADQVLDMLKQSTAYREGHFLLTSGRHSGVFLLCAQALQYPERVQQICRAMAEPFTGAPIDAVVGPAVGGIILAYEVARALGQLSGRYPRALFAEKAEGGGMALRRGFTLSRGERVLVVEDAVTTGGSVFKTLDAIRPFDITLAGVSIIADRSGGAVDFGAPLRSLITLQIDSWEPDACPLCRQGLPLTRPKG